MPFTDDVLQGVAPPVEGVSEATQLYLDQCRSVNGVLSPVAQPISFHEYLDEVKCLRERTTSGYAPQRYCQGLDLLIHKDPDDFRTSWLCPILLFDIEANMHNKHLAWVTMPMAERNGGIAQEQCCGRVRHSAEVQGLNVCMFYYQVKLNKVPATNTFVDLVSNYNLVYEQPMVTHCPTIAVTSGSSNCSHHHRVWVKEMVVLLAYGFLLALHS
eukprot:13516430-Ditylum_brightwellii.AAC.1